MSPLWVPVAGIIAAGAVVLTVALRRTRDEIAPTVRAFTEFRAALQPAVAALRSDAADARHRIARARSEIDGDGR
jgi:outer membrane murein-binding lipoprotein Lpp